MKNQELVKKIGPFHMPLPLYLLFLADAEELL